MFQAGASVVTPLGNTLTITGYNAATGVISYTYTLGAARDACQRRGREQPVRRFPVTLTDEDGDVDTDTLSVNIVDDVPTANDDAAALTRGRCRPSSRSTSTPTTFPAPTALRAGCSPRSTGTYGNLTLNPDGTQTYTLNAAGIAAIDALAPARR